MNLDYHRKNALKMNHMKKIFISEFAKILMECYKYLCASLLIFKTEFTTGRISNILRLETKPHK